MILYYIGRNASEGSMQIMIVGCGKMGTSLAVQLVSDGHRVTVIDRSESVIEQISNTQDVIRATS